MSSIYKELDVITVVCIISITTSYHIILFVVYILNTILYLGSFMTGTSLLLALGRGSFKGDSSGCLAQQWKKSAKVL